MVMQETDKLAVAEILDDGKLQTFMAELAAEHNIWLIGGTLPMVAGEAGNVLNATLVYSPDG